jgi:hypothetical protein
MEGMYKSKIQYRRATMNKRLVLELVVLILMMAGFASPARLVAGRDDPFSGLWTLNVEKSDTRLPAPQIVRINAAGKAIQVREEEVNQNGARTTVTIAADFNGKDCPVIGSPLADTAAYERVDNHTIKTTVKKGGDVVVREKLVVSQDGKTLTASFEELTGVAVFDKH